MQFFSNEPISGVTKEENHIIHSNVQLNSLNFRELPAPPTLVVNIFLPSRSTRGNRYLP